MNASYPEEIPINGGVEVIYGIICFAFAIFGIPANAFAFRYFLRKKLELSSMLYLFITGSDVLICICPIPIGISYFCHRNAVLFDSAFFCNFWMLSWRILSCVSIFYVAVLSVTRAYLLCFPFKQVSLLFVKIMIAVYLFLQLVISTNVFWTGEHQYVYSAYFVACDSVTDTPFPRDLLHIYNWSSRASYLFPIFPIVLSCLVSVVSISRYQSKYGGTADQEKVNASITIILFTLIYVFCNAPQAILNIIGGVDKSVLEPLNKWDSALYFQNFIYTMIVPLNSTLNPILYFYRMTSLRQELVSTLRWCQGNDRGQLVPRDTVVLSLKSFNSGKKPSNGLSFSSTA